jgi:hypothetical protein
MSSAKRVQHIKNGKLGIVKNITVPSNPKTWVAWDGAKDYVLVYKSMLKEI